MSLNKKRHLIVTSNELTWEFDRPTLLIDHNCISYKQLVKYKNLDLIYFKPILSNIDERERAYSLILKTTNQLLIELTDALNVLHNVNHSIRYWRIILGHWLHRYVSTLYNKYYSFKNCLEENYVSSITFFRDENKILMNDSEDFIWASNDNVWVNILYSKIFNYFENSTIDIKYISIDKINYTEQSRETIKPLKLQKIQSYLNKILILLSSEKDPLIINSYLSAKKELELKLRLGISPVFRNIEPIDYFKYDKSLRKILHSELKTSSDITFNNFLRKLLPDIIPKVFIEGYSRIKVQVKKSSWPKSPKFIFTSNCFDTDEFFKVYTAEKTIKRIPYYIGQHGNDYGTMKFEYSELECLETCDGFLTWGWSKDNHKYLPAFNLTMVGRKIKYNVKGGIVLVQNHKPHDISAWSLSKDYLNYIDNQFFFVKNIKESIKRFLTVRLHGSWAKMNSHEDFIWKHKCPNTKIDFGTKKFFKLFSSNRLIVFSYDSTGFLQALHMNFPVMAFWSEGYNNIDEKAISLYKKLEDANIIHFSVNSILEEIDRVWENPLVWWQSKLVQKSKNSFIEQYSNQSINPVKDLTKILK